MPTVLALAGALTAAIFDRNANESRWAALHDRR
jgi:hypothetical protein